MTTWHDRVVAALREIDNVELEDQSAFQKLWDYLNDLRSRRDGEDVKRRDGEITHYFRDEIDFFVSVKNRTIFVRPSGGDQEEYTDLEAALARMARIAADTIGRRIRSDRQQASKAEAYEPME